ncbi:MAG: hypothetical protein ACJ73N_01565, partial [Bryobacteraceae bacterium]
VQLDHRRHNRSRVGRSAKSDYDIVGRQRCRCSGLGGGILGSLGGLLGGGSKVTPEQAQQVPPEAVHQLAEQAEKNNPSIVDQVSHFYAEHPTLVQGLGAGALALIMSHMSRRS